MRTATLEATPAEAEKIALVTELGKLSLSLRSLGLNDQPAKIRETARVTWDSDTSLALRPENQPRSTMSVIRADKIETINVRRGTGS